MDVHSCHLLFDHFQFALIHGPNIPSSYAILLLQHQTSLPSPVPSTTGWCCFCFGCIPSFFLELYLHWSAVAYWAPTNLGSSSFSVLSFCLFIYYIQNRASSWLMVKNPPANAGDGDLIPGSGRFHGEGNGNPRQYSCLGNLMYRGAWWANVHWVAKSWTQPSN